MKISLITRALWYISIIFSFAVNLIFELGLYHTFSRDGFSGIYEFLNKPLIVVLIHLLFYYILFIQNNNLLKLKKIDVSKTSIKNPDPNYKTVVRWLSFLVTSFVLFFYVKFMILRSNDSELGSLGIDLFVILYLLLNLFHALSLIVISYKFRKKRKAYELQNLNNFSE